MASEVSSTAFSAPLQERESLGVEQTRSLPRQERSSGRHCAKDLCFQHSNHRGEEVSALIMKTEARTNKKTGRRKASYNTSGQLDKQRKKIEVTREMRERERHRD